MPRESIRRQKRRGLENSVNGKLKLENGKLKNGEIPLLRELLHSLARFIP